MGNSNYDAVVAPDGFVGPLIGDVTGNLTGDVVGDLTGDVIGNIAGQLTPPTVARTATSDGLTTAVIADAGLLQFVTVTSANAAHIITLPTPTPGTIVILVVGANGFELRSSDPATVLINDGTGGSAVESEIAANTMVIAVCKDATHWAALSLVGTTLAAVEAAA